MIEPTYTLIFFMCVISDVVPYFTDCQPYLINKRTAKECEVHRKTLMSKMPVWIDNPAHSYFNKTTAVPIFKPRCIPNPHMWHFRAHTMGLKFKDNRPEHLQPKSGPWEFKGYKPPGVHDEKLKGLDN